MTMALAGTKKLQKRNCDDDGCGQKSATCVSFVRNIQYHITYVAIIIIVMCYEFLNLFQCAETRHLRASLSIIMYIFLFIICFLYTLTFVTFKYISQLPLNAIYYLIYVHAWFYVFQLPPFTLFFFFYILGRVE